MLLVAGLAGCNCGKPVTPDGGVVDAGGCVENAVCARDAGAGICVAGTCLECAQDLQCGVAGLCSRATCVDHSCVRQTLHDGDGGFLSVPGLSAELQLAGGSATPIAAVWTGTDFLVAYQQAGVDLTELQQLSLDGGNRQAFFLPSSLKLLAANDAGLLGVFETSNEGVSAQLLSVAGKPLGSWMLEGVASNQPRAAGVAAGPDGFLVNWDYYNGRANGLALISNAGALTNGPTLKPGLLGESSAGRGAWSGSAFVLAWEDLQEHAANPEISAATIDDQGTPSPLLGAPALRSDESGSNDYRSPELVAVEGKLLLIANHTGAEVVIAPLDSTLTAITPALTFAATPGSNRPIAIQDGAHLRNARSSAQRLARRHERDPIPWTG